MQPGDSVRCPCGEWVEIEQGINWLIPVRGHRFHWFGLTAHRTGNIQYDARRTHRITEDDEIRTQVKEAA